MIAFKTFLTSCIIILIIHLLHIYLPPSLVDAQTDKKSKKNKWYQPWLDHATGKEHLARPLSVPKHVLMCFSLLPVLHSGEYYLFESDSEDEEDLQSEDQKPQKQTACRVWCQTQSSKSSIGPSSVLLSNCASLVDILLFLFSFLIFGLKLFKFWNAIVICFSVVLSPQLAYQAWVSSIKQALRERQRRQKQIKKMLKAERERKEASRKETSFTTGSKLRIYALKRHREELPMRREKRTYKNQHCNLSS